MADYLLAADVGGTKTEIALGHYEAGRMVISARRLYASQEQPGLEAIIDDFIAHLTGGLAVPAGAAACFAVAGPVEGVTARLTNLTWGVDGAALAQRYGFRAVRIINDFEAVGHGLIHLSGDELMTLQAGTPREHGVRLAIGAGTGLGVSLLMWEGQHYNVYPTEGGHADFGPCDPVQDELLAWLRRELGHVSYERILSGSGLVRVFQFFLESGYGMPSSALEEAMQRDDPASAVSLFALNKRDPLAVKALDLFVSVYGAYAGNMALSVLARGGVYVAGGIAPKIATKLTDGTFIRAFLDKGRFGELLATVPVHVVMNPAVGLYGALEVASRT